MTSEIELLVRVLDQAFDAKGWHGTTLAGSVRGLDIEQALWRPNPQRHSIWELVLHTAYWKYVVRRRLTGEPGRGGFARAPSNWPATPQSPGPKTWREDVALLKQSHADLREVVAAFPPERLTDRTPKGEWCYGELIHGVAAHDLYHVGQIQLLKRLYRESE